ncbi:metallophosphoesterase [Streptomyces sp. NPDC051561]|uniref:metallophosphoesterase n=1 Tax=Streptomyces sp. NPDC051561 TaxID=3365658 RepID=UPI00378BEA21
MVAVVVVVVVCVLALLGVVHWYVWKRLVRDTTGPGARGRRTRRAGAVAVVVLPLVSLGAVTSGRVGAPFWLQQVLAWPGFLWLAVLLYLTLSLLAAEALRPLLSRWLRRRDATAGNTVTPDTLIPDALTPDPAAPSDLPGSSPLGRRGRPPEAERAGKGAAPDGVATLTPDPPTPPTPTPTPPATPTLTRRLLISRTLATAATAAALATVGYGTHNVLRGPSVKRVTVPLARLPRSAHGFRIAVVSDIHLGPLLGRAHTQRIVDAINSTQPDLIAVVGDMVDGSVADLGRAAEPLAQLRAPHGNFFVTGNHEYYAGAAPWLAHVRELGLRPLENARVEIPGFDLAGVNDVGGEAFGQGPDFAAALGDRDRSRATVLLAHQPVQIHQAVRHGVDLQLSGHTHGGQLWPGNLIAELANPTVAGLEQYGDTQLYVSRGAGAWGPPVRVGAPSDITVVQLASRKA